MPIELDELERRRIQLEIEREALRKETDDASKARLEALEKELADIGEEAGAMKQRWEAEKAAIAALRATKSGARAAPGPDRAGRARGRLRHRRRAEVRQDAASSASGSPSRRRRIAALQGPGALLKEEVTADDIAEIVGRVDRHPGDAPAGGRAGEARPHGGAAARAGRRPGRGDRGRVRRRPPRPRRAQGPAPARSARSCSSGPPASARPSWRGRWPSSCSTTSTRWSAST